MSKGTKQTSCQVKRDRFCLSSSSSTLIYVIKPTRKWAHWGFQARVSKLGVTSKLYSTRDTTYIGKYHQITERKILSYSTVCVLWGTQWQFCKTTSQILRPMLKHEIHVYLCWSAHLDPRNSSDFSHEIQNVWNM